MYTGNPHQDRNPWTSFTGGFRQGWGDRNPLPWEIKDDSKMYPGGPPGDPKNVFPTFPLPRREDSENWIPYKGGGLGPLANYSTDKRIYNDWMIKDLLNQGSIGPGEVIDIGKPGYKQVVPKLMGQQLAMNRGLDNWGGNLKGTFDQPGYGDPSSLDPWGNDWGNYDPYNYDPYDDDVLDPGFGDHSIGPLYFG